MGSTRLAWIELYRQITSATGSHTITQLVSIDAAELVVVTTIDIAAIQPVTFRYKKK